MFEWFLAKPPAMQTAYWARMKKNDPPKSNEFKKDPLIIEVKEGNPIELRNDLLNCTYSIKFIRAARLLGS